MTERYKRGKGRIVSRKRGKRVYIKVGRDINTAITLTTIKRRYIGIFTYACNGTHIMHRYSLPIVFY